LGGLSLELEVLGIPSLELEVVDGQSLELELLGIWSWRWWTASRWTRSLLGIAGKVLPGAHGPQRSASGEDEGAGALTGGQGCTDYGVRWLSRKCLVMMLPSVNAMIVHFF
jgi:hypothetical protein